MRTSLYAPILIFIVLACGPSETTWQSVARQLEQIQERDQRYRKQMDSVARSVGWQSAVVARLYDEQKKLDSINLIEVEQLISRVGYPTKARVGDLTSVPFNVIQHSGDSVMINYLELISGAGKNGDLPMNQVAAFHDKVLVALRQPQEYGTQIWIDFIKNKKTGEQYDSVYLWPVRNAATVDARRISVGLDSLATHLRRYKIDPSQGYLLKKSEGAPY